MTDEEKVVDAAIKRLIKNDYVAGLIKNAVAAEREACAKVAEQFIVPHDMRTEEIAAAIRARGNAPESSPSGEATT